MTIQTRSVFGKVSYIRKRGVAFADFLKVLRRNFVTGIARKLLGDGMSLM